MNCDIFEEKLHQDSLSDQEQMEMARHAESCFLCRMKADLKEMRPNEDIPQEAASGWRQAVLEEAEKKTVRRTPVWARYASLVAALVILIAGGTQIRKIKSDSPAFVTDAATESAMYAAESASVPAMGSVLYEMADSTEEDEVEEAVPEQLAAADTVYESDAGQLAETADSLPEGGSHSQETDAAPIPWAALGATAVTILFIFLIRHIKKEQSK